MNLEGSFSYKNYSQKSPQVLSLELTYISLHVVMHPLASYIYDSEMTWQMREHFYPLKFTIFRLFQKEDDLTMNISDTVKSGNMIHRTFRIHFFGIPNTTVYIMTKRQRFYISILIHGSYHYIICYRGLVTPFFAFKIKPW